MELTEVEIIIERYAKQCLHCTRKTSIIYENEWTCFSCGLNVTKRKNQLTKIPRRKINFINRIKYSKKRNEELVLMFVEYMKMMIMIKCLNVYQD